MTAAAKPDADELELPAAERAIFERRIRGLVTPGLVAEHCERPFGSHSAALVELLHFLRRNVALNRPRYVCLRDGDPPVWRVGVAGGRGEPFAAVDETTFQRREDVEHAVFLRRLSDLGLS